MDTLRVRVYNVLFGDAILVTVPDKNETTGKTVNRNILIDVGNVLTTKAQTGEIIGDDAVFKPVLEDIQQVLDGQPLDLYVMTHEHLDHVQGLFHCSKTHQINLEVDYAWLTASAAEDYYDRFPDAKKEKKLQLGLYDDIEKYFALTEMTDQVRAILNNNNPRSTADCIDYLRKLAKKETSYVFRGSKPKHSFKEAKFEILAPEENTFDYYRKLHPLSLGMSSRSKKADKFELTEMMPPAGIDAGAFFNLVEARRGGVSDNLLAIDKAANDTSIVFLLEWRGWRLLFSGDAEERSWKMIAKNAADKLQPIHLLKVSHHGSSNGMPVKEVLDVILPEKAPDKKKRFAAVSTCLGAYNGVPHDDTLNLLRGRCEVKSTKDDLKTGKNYFDLEFKA
jgi:hypothetical protein